MTPRTTPSGVLSRFWLLLFTLGAVLAALGTAQQTLPLSGTIIDFKTAGHPDFGKNTDKENESQTFVQQLLNIHNLPVMSTKPSSVESAETFAEWFDPGYDLADRVEARAIVLNRVGGTLDVFEYAGDLGFTAGDLFTYHLTVFADLGSSSRSLTFGSAGDMWIFREGVVVTHTFAGIHTAKSTSVTVQGGPARFDIFYAHRSSLNQPFFRIQMLQQTQCSAESSGLRQDNIYPFTPSNTRRVPEAAVVIDNPGNPTTSAVKLTDSSHEPSGACFWNPKRFRIENGFTTEFRVRITRQGTKGAEGFAFVINGMSNTDRGGSAGNLGYNFNRNLAIEFDTAYSPGLDGALIAPHVAVHSTFATAGPNSAGSAGYLTGVSHSSLNSLTNGNYQTIRIVYTPGTTHGTIKVYFNSRTPLLTYTTLDQHRFNQMYDARLAWLGFCASTGEDTPADVQISHWRVWTTPASAAFSRTVPAYNPSSGWGQGIVARDTPATNPTLQVQATDSCGNVISVSVDTPLQVRLLDPADDTPLITTPHSNWQDLGNGLYDLRIFHEVAEDARLQIQMGGQDIHGSPFPTSIIAAPIHAGTSTHDFTESQLTAGVPKTVILTAKDRFGNENTVLSSDFTLRFSTANESITPISSNPPYYTFSAVTTVAAPGVSLYFRHGSADLLGSPAQVDVVPSSPDPATTEIESIGGSLLSIVAGQQGRFRVYLHDEFRNDITEQSTHGIRSELTLGSETILGVPVWKPGAGSRPPHFEVTFQGTKAGQYDFALEVNGAAVPEVGKTYSPNILPDVENLGESVFQDHEDTPSVLRAGVEHLFLIQARDQYGNDRTIPNSIADFFITVTGPGPTTTAQVPCGSTQASLPSQTTDVESLTCQHDTNGKYLLQVVGKTAGSYTITLGQPGSTDPNPTRNFVLRPGAPHAGTSVVTLVDDPGSALEAGVPQKLSITYKDVYGNVRVDEDDSERISTELRMIDDGAAFTIGSAQPEPLNSGVYTVSFTPQIVGDYEIDVKDVGPLMNGSPIQFSVKHTAVSPPDIEVFGPGITGGTSKSRVDFFIRPRDRFLNYVLDAETTDFTIDVSPAPEDASYTVTESQGTFQVNYEVVTCSQTEFLYDLEISYRGDVFQSLEPVCVQDSISWAVAGDSGRSKLRAGEGGATFLVQDQGQDGIPRFREPTDPMFNAVFANVLDSSVADVRALVVNEATDAPAVDSSGPYKLTIDPPEKVGLYRLYVRFGVIATEESKPGVDPDDPLDPDHGRLYRGCFPGGNVDQCLEVVPGDVDPATCLTSSPASFVAGQTNTVTVQLRDAFRNTITEEDSINIWPVFPTAAEVSWTPQAPANGVLKMDFTTQKAGNIDGVRFLALNTDVCSSTACEADPYAPTCQPMTCSPGACPAGQICGGDYGAGCCILSETPFGDLPINFVAHPDVPSDKSTLDIESGVRLTVGTDETIWLTARDQFGNLITDTQSVFELVLEDNAGSSNYPMVTRSRGNGRFTVNFRPVTSNQEKQLTLQLKWNDNLLTSTEVWVDPGELDPNGGELRLHDSDTNLMPYFVAGEEVRLRLWLVDLYGNPWFSGRSTGQLVLSKPGHLCGAPVDTVVTAVDPEDVLGTPPSRYGVYELVFTPFIATDLFLPDDLLQLTINFGGITVRPDRLRPFAVLPNILRPDGKALPPVHQVLLPAGTTGELTVDFQDHFCNPIRHASRCDPSGVYCNTLLVDFFRTNEIQCDETRTDFVDTRNNVNDLFESTGVPVVTHNPDGTFTVRYNTERAGSYTAWLRVGRPPLPGETESEIWPPQPVQSCQDHLSFAFEVTPLQPYGPMSILGGPAINAGAMAGEAQEFSITLRDMYGNPTGDRLPTGWSIQVGEIPVTDNDHPCHGVDVNEQLEVLEDCIGEGILTLEELASTTCSQSCIDYRGDGVYSVCFREGDAKVYPLVAAIDNGASLDVIDLRDDCPTLVVHNSWVDRFLEDVPDPAPLGIVGIPDDFRIETWDRFDNPAVVGGHYYTVTFTLRTEDSGLDVDYSFIIRTTPDPLPDKQIVRYMVSWAGTYDVRLDLVEDPRYVREERDMNTASFVLEFSAATCAQETSVSTPYRCRLDDDRQCVSSYTQCDVTAWPETCDPTQGEMYCAATDACLGAEDFVENCPCPDTDYVRCDQGHCVPSLELCPVALDTACPTWAPHRCPVQSGGRCVQDESHCPTPFVCRPGFVLCADARSCAESYSDCPDFRLDQEPRPGNDSWVCEDFFCPSGRCVKSLEDCETRTTCGGRPDETGDETWVLCQDGSCRESATECPDQYPCFPPNTYQCPDGSCRRSLQDCPNQPSCGRQGLIRCEDGSCKASLAECGPAIVCTQDQVRCPDGTCRPNMELCPTPVTCPVGSGREILCPNGACVRTWSECGPHPSCPPGLQNVTHCPDGTCVSGARECPTPPTCPVSHPVLCPNRECRETAADCDMELAPVSCPAARPFRCPDGSCAGDQALCPTLPACPENAPVRCADRRCAAAETSCVPWSALQCPEDRPFRCPNGNCAPNPAVCPTESVCPGDLVRCPDGSCREAKTVEKHGREEAACTRNALRLTCLEPTDVLCPMIGVGSFCAKDISLCPVGTACPADTPYRCPDSRCERDPRECQDPSVKGYSSGKYACPGGTWARELSQCGDPTWCPVNAPAKCWDETCRVVPEDCPRMPGCDPERTPYLCFGGGCANSIHACSSLGSCPSATPYRCPSWIPDEEEEGTGSSGRGQFCVADLSECLDPFDTAAYLSMDSPDSRTKCPLGERCKDGSCRQSRGDCSFGVCYNSTDNCQGPGNFYSHQGWTDVTLSNRYFCPHYTPHLCPSGLCVRHAQECMGDNSTGCHFPNPHRCGDGSCVQGEELCPVVLRNRGQDPCPTNTQRCPNSDLCVHDITRDCLCPEGTALCDDAPVCVPCEVQSGGRCVPEDSHLCGRQTKNSCPSNAPYMCHDGTCVPLGGSSSPPNCLNANDVTSNACPPWRPYRCDDGFCAVSSTQCPITPQQGICLNNIIYRQSLFTGRWAEQSAAEREASLGTELYQILFPNVYPVVCADGSCALGSHQCPVVAPCFGDTQRCPDGSCREFCPPVDTCANLARSLPTIFFRKQRCPNGLCAVDEASCVDDSQDAGGCPQNMIRCANSGACVEDELECFIADAPWNQVLGNGCPIVPSDPRPLRCWDGTCVRDLDSCSNRNGCPPNEPILCPSGVCAEQETECMGLFSGDDCPEGEHRCGNGHCSRIGHCVTDLRCPETNPVRCALAEGGSLCRRYPAIDPSLLDPEVYELRREDMCPTTVVCDTDTPHLCASGECVADPIHCRPVLPCTDPAAPFLCRDFSCAADETSCPRHVQDRCPPMAPALCRDGSCRRSVLECPEQSLARVEECRRQLGDENVHPFRCWDGFCARSPLECVRRRQIAFQNSTELEWSDHDLDHSAEVCPDTEALLDPDTGRLTLSGEFLCPDGACVLHRSQCGVLPRCPNTHPFRCTDGACVREPSVCERPEHQVEANCLRRPELHGEGQTPIRGVDGTCRLSEYHVEFEGCPSTAPYFCPGLASPCVRDRAACPQHAAVGAPVELENGWENQEACGKDCERDNLAIPQTITIPLLGDVKAVVSQDRWKTPRTEITVHSGAVGGQGYLHIHPVSSRRLPDRRHPFHRDVLSTPFACNASRSGPFFFDLTVEAAIDRTNYTALQQAQDPDTAVDPNTIFPCQYRRRYNYETLGERCGGTVEIVDGVLKMQTVLEREPDCPRVLDYQARVFAVDEVTGGHCVQIQVESSGTPAEMPVGDQVFLLLQPSGNHFQASMYDDERRYFGCPLGFANPVTVNWYLYDARPAGAADPCFEEQQTGAPGAINPADICLARHSRPSGSAYSSSSPQAEEGWRCIDSLQERLDMPVWTNHRGGSPNRVLGRLDRCDPDSAYAFVWIPPPPQTAGGSTSRSAWEKYGWIILLCAIVLTVCLILAGFYFWRQMRYRRKFKEEQRQKEALQDEARRLDEFAGGLGLGDEDVDMVANPLVVEMQRLDREIKQVNLELERAAKAEEQEIEDLQEQRQAIYAEIQRVKAELARQEAMAPTRTELGPTAAPGLDADSLDAGEEDYTAGGGGGGGMAGPQPVAAPVRHQNFGRTTTSGARGARRPKKKDL